MGQHDCAPRATAWNCSKLLAVNSSGSCERQIQPGEHFAAVLSTSRVWLNGDPTTEDAVARGADEVAVLPPVSGG